MVDDETKETSGDRSIPAEPLEEHRWLERLVGDWTYEGEAVMEPGGTPETFSGSEAVRSIGGIWVQAVGTGAMPGGDATTIMTLGYDPRRGRFVGTFIASMMTHQWLYEGTLDAAGNVLTLATEGPDMAQEGRTARYQDVIEFAGDDRRELRSRMLGDDGAWRPVMTARYRRRR